MNTPKDMTEREFIEWLYLEALQIQISCSTTDDYQRGMADGLQKVTMSIAKFKRRYSDK